MAVHAAKRSEIDRTEANERVKQMTLEEKCSLLSGEGNFITKGISRLGIPQINLSDGPHGVRRQVDGENHLGLGDSLPATCFPTAAAIANAWDPDLCEEVGKALGEEAKAQRVHVLLGPALNIKRSPLCGRNFEYFSEDPYLSGKLAAAYIRGIQSNGIGACPKHFAANSQELLRMHSDSVLDQRTLREIYLTAFEIAVKEGNPRSIMSAYNKINGVYASENSRLLREILVNEWGVSGFVVTDWGASNDRVQGLVAGNHLEMPATGGSSDREVMAAVREGRLSEELLDQRVAEYVRVIGQVEIPEKETTSFDAEAHHALARKAAGESIVLLKNEENILPLKPGTKVAVIGDFAQMPRYQGAGSSAVNPTRLDVPLDCLKESGLEIVGYEPGFLRHGGEDEGRKQAAQRLAETADVVLLYLGLDEYIETESLDRTEMTVRRNQVEVLMAVAAVNSNIVVVFSGGAPVECPWIEVCKAFVHGYLSGQAGAGAMADVLTGTINPSGKLNESWPMCYEDTPAYQYYPGREKTAEYRESLFVGYRYYNTTDQLVRFAFGFGLSYTSFTYRDLKVDPNQVAVTIANTGEWAGAEVVQVYIGKEKSEIFRPSEELKGFQKVFLAAGESRRIEIPLDDKAFRFFNIKSGKFEVENGRYIIKVGSSSRDIRLCEKLEIVGTSAKGVYDRETLPGYFSGMVSCMGDEEFAQLLGYPIPCAAWDRTAELTMNDTFSQLFYAKGWLGRMAYRLVAYLRKKTELQGKPDINITSVYNLPFRGLAKQLGGAIDMPMAEAILEMFNGHFLQGTKRLIAGALNRKKNTK